MSAGVGLHRFAVPTLASGLAAALSILFYAGFAQLFGDRLLGQVIVTLSAVALLQIAVVPQAWVYIAGAHADGEIDRRYALGVVFEWAGGAIGLLLLAAALALPLASLDGYRGAAAWQYLALWMAGSTSAQGWFRAHEHWRRYAAWVVLPNLVRVALIAALWLHPAVAAGLGRAELTAVFFVLPELARWLPLNAVVLLRRFRVPARDTVLPGARAALQNWLFDIGSALTEVADKVVVGALLGPQLLVVYFFARKVGVAATMVVEPIYAEHYRRHARGEGGRRTFATGAAAALAAAALLLAGVAAVLASPLAGAVPVAVAAHVPLFAALVVIDALIAANRWSRFLSQLRGRAAALLAARLLLFGVFAALLAANPGGPGLLTAFAAFWAAEALLVALWLARP